MNQQLQKVRGKNELHVFEGQNKGHCSWSKVHVEDLGKREF